MNIRRDPGNHFFLILQQHGRSHLSQGDVSTWSNPGDMFVVDSTRESVFRYLGRYSLQLSVHLPRDEMCHRFGKRIYGGLAISADDPLCVAMKALLAKLIAGDKTDTQAHTVEAFYSVFGALLTERALGNHGSVDPDRRMVQRAVTLIGEHFRDPDFSTRALAALMGVSLRRLQRAFQITGETPHDRLQRFRVETARQAILQNAREGEARSITTLAFDHGFGDLSTFYRLHRKHFDCAPGEITLALPSDACRKSN